MKETENKEKNHGFETLSDSDLEKIFGGQSVTQPASVSGTLGQALTISCSGGSNDDYHCGRASDRLSGTAASLFKNRKSVPGVTKRADRKR